MLFKSKRIFLDYAGGEENPSGIHAEGRQTKQRLEQARQRVADLLHCQTRNIIFTSGSTESDNLGLLGLFEVLKQDFPKPHIIVSNEEHPAVLEVVRELERRGAELSIVPAEKVFSTIKDNTVLVSVSFASSETGSLHHVPKLARAIRSKRSEEGKKFPILHTDATQAYEFEEIDVNKVQADLITIGRVLVVRPPAELKPIIFGGGQEMGLRSGTEDLKSIEGFVGELERAVAGRAGTSSRLTKLKELFLSEVERVLPQAVVNTRKQSLPHIVSISFPGKLHEFLAIQLDEKGIAVSTGSACDSRKNEPDKEALRFSFGPNTSESDIKETIRVLAEIVL